MNLKKTIKKPHAAMVVWNYVERGGHVGFKDKKSYDLLISTYSIVSMATSRSKSEPSGSFKVVLAPNKNWVSYITPGSWCAILMSQDEITKEDITRANIKSLRFIGRVESVRVQTSVDQDGVRRTMYFVSGTEWSDVFNSVLHIDNSIREKGNNSALNEIVLMLRAAIYGNSGAPRIFSTTENLRNLLNILGANPGGSYRDHENNINRIAKSVYNFNLPENLSSFLNTGFRDNKNTKNKQEKPRYKTNVFTELVKIKTGSLVRRNGLISEYDNVAGSHGIIDVFSLQGVHSLWEIMLSNSNQAINEMFTEIEWPDDSSPVFTLYNRFKPFCIEGILDDKNKTPITSFFQRLPAYYIDPVNIISINAGTNWRDKINFIELKPLLPLDIVQNYVGRYTHAYDASAFDREGLRPLILGVTQLPININQPKSKEPILWHIVQSWANTMKHWYFNTHRMLNGTIDMVGSDIYIPVGANVYFPLESLFASHNFNTDSAKNKSGNFILAHIESVSHMFSIDSDGKREYRTSISFVRGIVVNGSFMPVGDGGIDYINRPQAQGNNKKQVTSSNSPQQLDSIYSNLPSTISKTNNIKDK